MYVCSTGSPICVCVCMRSDNGTCVCVCVCTATCDFLRANLSRVCAQVCEATGKCVMVSVCHGSERCTTPVTPGAGCSSSGFVCSSWLPWWGTSTHYPYTGTPASDTLSPTVNLTVPSCPVWTGPASTPLMLLIQTCAAPLSAGLSQTCPGLAAGGPCAPVQG